MTADQWCKSPDGARNVTSWPPDGARHPQCTCAASACPSAGPGPRGNVFVCLLLGSALQHFYTLQSSSAEEHVKRHTAQLCSSCPVPRGDTSAAFPLVCRISEPSCPFVLRTGARRGEDFASILKPTILLEKKRKKISTSINHIFSQLMASPSDSDGISIFSCRHMGLVFREHNLK